jgi:aminoglycoside 6'-N-acetyltransferase
MPPDRNYSFRPVTEADFGLLRGWLTSPHVARWWGDADEALSEMGTHLAEGSTVEAFIVSLDGAPFAYIQSYDMDREIDHPYAPQPKRTFGIDQSIGIEALTGKGHGPAMMKAFCDRLFAAGASRIITDPETTNDYAIRAYEKAGFRKDRIITSDYGTVWLMMLERPAGRSEG